MNREKVLKILKYVFCISIILVLCLYKVEKYFQNDLFFDIKTGESLLKYGLDFKDHFSFIPNLKYLYHHYLYDLLMIFIYRKFNFTGIGIFFLMIYSIFGIVVFAVNKSRSKSYIFPFIVAVFTVYICRSYFTSRVQSITNVLFFLEVFLLEKLYKTGEKKYLVFLIIESIVIANIHMPLWILTIILALPFVAEMALVKLSKKVNILKNVKLEKPKNEKLFIIGFVLLCLCGLVSPFKLYPYVFFTKTLFNSSYNYIIEITPPALFYFKLYVIMLVLYLFSAYFRMLKLSFRNFCMVVGLFVFGLIAGRNMIYPLMILPSLFLYSISINNKIEFKKIKSFFNKINWTIIYPILIILIGALYINLINKVDYLHSDFYIRDYFPYKSVKYLKEKTDYKNITIYNDFNYGSYMEFYDIPVFIDSRAEVYIKELNGGKDVFSDWVKTNDLEEWKKVFKKYDFEYALVEKYSNIGFSLQNDKDYKKIMEENDTYVLYQKINKEKKTKSK